MGQAAEGADQIRRPGEIKFPSRDEKEWPLARTEWTKLYLDPEAKALTREPPKKTATLTYEAMGEGVDVSDRAVCGGDRDHRPVSAEDRAVVGDERCRCIPCSSGFRPEGQRGRLLRRPRSDIRRSRKGGCAPRIASSIRREVNAYRPYHTHDEIRPLKPGEPADLDIEIWPTCIVIPKGYRLALTIRGKDYEYEGPLSDFAKTFHYAKRGVGPFQHADPDDRPKDIFGGQVTLHSGGARDSYVLVPIVPPRAG